MEAEVDKRQIRQESRALLPADRFTPNLHAAAHNQVSRQKLPQLQQAHRQV